MRQVRRRDARAVIANVEDQPFPDNRAVTSIVESDGEYWAAFSSRWASAVAVKPRVEPDGTSGSTVTSTLSCSVCST